MPRPRRWGRRIGVTLLVLLTPLAVLGLVIALHRTEEWMLRETRPPPRWRAAPAAPTTPRAETQPRPLRRAPTHEVW